jgi:hypothetical protein
MPSGRLRPPETRASRGASAFPGSRQFPIEVALQPVEAGRQAGPCPEKGKPPGKTTQVDFDGVAVDGEIVRPRIVVMVNARRGERPQAANEAEVDGAIRETEGKLATPGTGAGDRVALAGLYLDKAADVFKRCGRTPGCRMSPAEIEETVRDLQAK